MRRVSPACVASGALRAPASGVGRAAPYSTVSMHMEWISDKSESGRSGVMSITYDEGARSFHLRGEGVSYIIRLAAGK